MVLFMSLRRRHQNAISRDERETISIFAEAVAALALAAVLDEVAVVLVVGAAVVVMEDVLAVVEEAVVVVVEAAAMSVVMEVVVEALVMAPRRRYGPAWQRSDGAVV